MSAPVALVTGAARGIGAATAVRLAADGYRVVALDSCADDSAVDYSMGTRAELDQVVSACGNDARAEVADVRDPARLSELVSELDRLDAVVAAAGVVWGGEPLWSMPDDAWQAVMGVNVTGVFNTARAAVPRLLTAAEPERCRFVAVASAAGTRGLPSMAAYSASKHAVVGLVRSLAAELGSSGVTANAVAPGSTSTEILAASARAYELGSPTDFALHHLNGRLLGPEEIAEAVAWLCSPAASAVTGAVIAVDGGMTAA